jgi:hypothetical protein
VGAEIGIIEEIAVYVSDGELPVDLFPFFKSVNYRNSQSLRETGIMLDWAREKAKSQLAQSSADS